MGRSEDTKGIRGLLNTKVLPLFFFLLAIYTLFSLLSAAVQVSRSSLELSPKAPDDRCIPFFDTVKAFTERNANTTTTLYDYMATEALVRVCTDLNESVMISAIGLEYAYDPFTQQGCPLSTSRAQIVSNCNRFIGMLDAADIADQYTCSTVLDYRPTPNGLFWNHGVYKVTENVTEQGTGRKMTPPPCTFRITRLSYAKNGGLIPQCARATVGVFHRTSAKLTVFLYAVVAVPVLIFIAQCYFLYSGSKDGWFDEDDHWKLGFAMRGIPGPVYKGYWIFCKNDAGDFPHSELTPLFWFICATQDVIEGCVATVVAVWGCSVGRFPIPVALLALKVIKILFDTYTFWSQRAKGDTDGDMSATNSTFQPSAAAQTAYTSTTEV